MSLEDRRRRDTFTLDVFPKKSKSKSEKKSSCKFMPDNERKVEVIDWPVPYCVFYLEKK